MDLDTPEMATARIKLELLNETHREPLRATDAIEFMWQSMPVIQRGSGFDAYFDYMLKCQKAQDAVPFAIVCPDTGRLVGVTAFIQPNRLHRRVEIGYTWIDESMRGKGIFQLLQYLMIERALEWGARRIGWQVEAHNERAIRAIEALGAVREGTLRNYARFSDGTWVDIAILSMLRDEAKAALHRLSARLALPQA